MAHVSWGKLRKNARKIAQNIGRAGFAQKLVTPRSALGLCRVGTEPSAVAPGQSDGAGVYLAFDPALPRSVLCLLGITDLFSSVSRKQLLDLAVGPGL